MPADNQFQVTKLQVTMQLHCLAKNLRLVGLQALLIPKADMTDGSEDWFLKMRNALTQAHHDKLDPVAEYRKAVIALADSLTEASSYCKAGQGTSLKSALQVVTDVVVKSRDVARFAPTGQRQDYHTKALFTHFVCVIAHMMV